MTRAKNPGAGVRVKDVCSAMEAWAPASLAYEWDTVGLSVGNPEGEVSRALVALSVTRDTFKAAKKAHAQMIVAHHPLLFKPLKALRTDDPHTRLCLDIAAENMACFSAHTNLDLATGGVNDILADRLGLQSTSPLIPAPGGHQVKLVTFVPEFHLEKVRNEVCRAGAGVIGGYTHCTFSTSGVGTFMPGEGTQPFSGRKMDVNEEPEKRLEVLVPKSQLSQVLAALFESHPYEEVAYDVIPLENRDPTVGLGRRGTLASPRLLDEFAKEVRKALDTPHVRMVGQGKRRISTVGVLGGSGGGELAKLPAGLDVLVTGDIKYHQAQQALDQGIGIIDAGHAATEKWSVQAIAGYLRNRLPALKVSTYIEPEVFSIIAE